MEFTYNGDAGSRRQRKGYTAACHRLEDGAAVAV